MSNMEDLNHLINAVEVARAGGELASDMMNLLLSIRTFRRHLLPGQGYSEVKTKAFRVIERETAAMLEEFKE